MGDPAASGPYRPGEGADAAGSQLLSLNIPLHIRSVKLSWLFSASVRPATLRQLIKREGFVCPWLRGQAQDSLPNDVALNLI